MLIVYFTKKNNFSLKNFIWIHYMNLFEIESLQKSKFNIFILIFLMLVVFILLYFGIKMTDDYLRKNVHHNEKIIIINDLEKQKKNKHKKKHHKHHHRHNNNQHKEVYNISENIYTYNDAPYVCKLFGGELATYEQLKQEYSRGADWCNYGWSQGQNAYYPTQKKSWDKLQETENNKDMCGNPGINGGYFANPDLKFGVNCYGIKPKKSPSNSSSISQDTYKTPEQLEAEKKMMELESQKKDIQILPFNRHEWSMNQETNSKSFISNNSSD